MPMSDKSIAERLQVKNARTLAVIGADAKLDRAIGAKQARADLESADVILYFVGDFAAFGRETPRIFKTAKAGVILWVAYPKLTSKLAGDLNRDVIHRHAPQFGLDTVSQIAIDDTWSAMRLKPLK
jgi:hypothetical protein